VEVGGDEGGEEWEEGMLTRGNSWGSEREAGTERMEHKQTSPRQSMGSMEASIIRRNIVRIGFRKGVVGLRLEINLIYKTSD
jgi:hypothetical protein